MLLDGRGARGRPQRRLPPADTGELRRLVQGAAHRARAARRGGLRTARILPRPHPGGAPGLESGLLSDRGQSRHPAAGRSRAWSTAPPGIVCDAKSGVSGAGRKPSLKTSFCEVTENFSAYSILHHRHVPEVLQISGLEEREFSFTAQLLPLDRGILETIYFRDDAGVDRRGRCSTSTSSATPASRSSASTTRATCPTCARVARTNFCDIGVTVRRRHRPRRRGQRHRQPGQGRRRTGRPEHEPDARASRDRGTAVKLLVKLGGTLLDAAGIARRAGARRSPRRARHGVEIVVVHGGGKQMTRYLAERGIESRFVNGLRVTTPGDHRRGAEGVRRQRQSRTGRQPESRRRAGRRAHRHRRASWSRPSRWIRRWARWAGSRGRIRRCWTCWSANGYLPVVACVAGDRQGKVYNVNADQMAVACAAAFGAEQLVFLTDVEGVLDARQAGSPAAHRGARAAQLIADGVATGGMQAKLNAALAALDGGVGAGADRAGRVGRTCWRGCWPARRSGPGSCWRKGATA